MTKKIVCFGEMLWDCFPDGEVAGGAPMNVALNLKQLGLDVEMISRLGNDAYGEKLKDFLRTYDLPLQLVQEDSEHPTGKVLVDNSDKENIKYEIVEPSAWDFIALTEANQKSVEQADALIFGSLGVRNETSWKTLYHLVHQPLLTVFDINLRAPYIDFYKIDSLLGYTDILKINEDELEILADFFELRRRGESLAKDLCDYLVEEYPIEAICITHGSKGAMVYKDGKIISHPGYKVKVEDTVGAGDAFLSGFVKMYLEGKKPQEILDFACKLGAYVASQKGGTPKYSLEEVNKVD
ncbi:sugar kinase, ribokinase [Belliella baltica DSM 15883]|uniref:Sugar kinase, ribokinase n=1 Tax=Belliella baltica (strain DSM 15883 / CIP 108006 / LMG 21964 / BA134) TaxID=866536 RepID=I3ZA12_BELBD|nr:carbohydrate kinase [Belliella baltica]AFL86080.1 sugar kinase, ribokinase [Belliella baltica DSM 15883]